MAFGDRKKKKYAEFYETPTGEIIYTGTYKVYDVQNPLPYRRWRIVVALSCTGSAILAAAGGFYRAPGMDRTLSVMLSYVFLLGFTVMQCWRGAQSVRAGNPMRAFDYRNALQPTLHWTYVSAVFALILLVFYFVHLVRSGTEGCAMAAVVAFPLMAALIAASDLWLAHTLRKNVWRDAPEDAQP